MLKENYLKVEKVINYKIHDSGVAFNCSCGIYTEANININFYSSEIVRVHFSKGKTEKPKKSVSVIKEKDNNQEIEVIEENNKVFISSDSIKIEVNLDPWYLIYYDNNKNMLTKEVIEDKTTWNNQLNKPRGITVKSKGQDLLNEINSTHVSLLLGVGEKFYGFGEKFTRLNKTGQKITMWNKNAQGARSEDSYKNIPFFISSNNYGVFVDNTSKIEFNMGNRSNRAYGIDVYEDDLDYYFIYGSKPLDIIEKYTELTGRPPYPPEWSFGLWLSTYFIEANEGTVRNQIDTMRNLNIPCDVYHFDCHWLRDDMWNDFEWDKKAFPNPYNLIDELHEKNYKVSLWENPYISVFSDLYNEGKKKGYFLTKEDGSVYEAQTWRDDLMALTGIVDFTNPEAQEWYKNIHRKLINKGIDVFKTDFGEDIPVDANFYNGKTGKEMRNIYSLLYNKTVYEVTEEESGNSLVWSRSGWAGSQRFPTHWGGDPHCTWEDMANTLRAGLSMAMSGVAFWSHDIGGFKGEPSNELYIRWAQFGLLSPHSRLHGWGNRNPWHFSDEVTDIFKKFTELRYKLLPYIFSYAKVAEKLGYPLMRPMVLEFPDDPVSYELEFQYMFGSEMLIAPILSADNKVEFYLPQGKWYNFWNGEIITGGKFLKQNIPLDKIPIYIPSGSIIPMGPVMNYVNEKTYKPLTINIYPGNESINFNLYNGNNLKFYKNDQKNLVFESEKEDKFVLKIYALDENIVNSIKVDDKSVEFVNKENFDQGKSMWTKTKNNIVMISNVNKNALIKLNN